MNIIIKDEQGLGTVLQMAGYSQEQRIWARNAIRKQFSDAAQKVFQEVLDKPLPETIIVNTSLSDNDELKGEKAALLAFYYSSLSEINRPVFYVREISVKELLEGHDIKRFEGTTVHEMFHAADQYMLINHTQLVQKMHNQMDNNVGYLGQAQNDHSMALLQTLNMFHHYRAEGIAVAGESLLMKDPVPYNGNPISRFQGNFLKTMMNSCHRADGNKTNVYDTESISLDAYEDAPFVLMLVLYNQGFIEQEVAQKAVDAMSKGRFELTEEEVHTILRCAIDLPLTGFIEGLMMLGEDIAPIQPFLFFCGKIQNEFDESNANAFAQLALKPESSDVFNAFMDQIMGCVIPENELDRHYEAFINKDKVDPSYPQLKEKLTELYSILKDDANAEKKVLAQWALTYFFDDEDVIHDNISSFGLIDDMAVLDYAIKLIRQ